MFTGDPTAAELLFVFERPKMERPYLPYINLFPVFQVWGCFSNSHFGVVFEFRFRHGFSVPSLINGCIRHPLACLLSPVRRYWLEVDLVVLFVSYWSAVLY
jgi:hypothetical protein